MSMRTLLAGGAAAAVLALLPAAASAQRVQSGSANGLAWTATNYVVGQNSTATTISGGNPLYLPTPDGRYSGTVGLLMTYANGSAFVCSGSLLNDRRSVLTAAHCVSDGGVNTSAGLVSTTAFFYDHTGIPLDPAIYSAPAGVTTIGIDYHSINSSYTGAVIDQNDIAVLRLSDLAPAFATAYDLYDTSDLAGDIFNVTGYGTRSVTGGVDGTTGPGAGAGSGRLRQGYNQFDYRFGDEVFDGFWTDIIDGTNFFGTTAEIDFTYLSDFDNGLAVNDANCRLGQATGAGTRFCNTGLGIYEVGIAGGDSGGAGFIDGKIASVNSFGLSFGANFGDIKPGLQSSFGELNGFVPTFIHTDFIRTAMAVPEPATWAMMIAGFGLVGGAMRRRQSAAVAA